ncbi:hypothetical protein [Coralliovum pocilloporae]|uniref:hypothetical protein n=1 Tax=Coralliovum pocilloporae TaxID=3066369 RepID=UPI003307B772
MCLRLRLCVLICRLAFGVLAIPPVFITDIAKSHAASLDEQTEKIVALMEKDFRIFGIVFKTYPDERRKAKRQARRALKSKSASQRSKIMRDYGLAVSNKYFHSSVQAAKNSKLYNYMKVELQTSKALRRNPRVCLKFIFGKGLARNDLSGSMIKRISDAKAGVIESALKHPQKRVPNVSDDRLGELLRKGYSRIGVPIENILLVEEAEKKVSKEHCQAMINFQKAVIALGRKEGVDLYKFLAR